MTWTAQGYGILYQGGTEVFVKCGCGRNILTTRQIHNKQPCIECQKEHAREFHEKYDFKKEE